MTHQFDICESCGSDPFKTKDYDKIVSEKAELSSRFKRLSANHGVERAEWILKEISLEEGMKYLQRKHLRQARAIRNLESKLKRLGEQPYKEEGIGALEPGMTILDGSTVISRIEYKSPDTVIITGYLAPGNEK